MPYKDWRSLNVTEDIVKKWAEDLSSSTAKNYVYYFLKYLEWVKEKGYWSSAKEMIEDYKSRDLDDRYRHLDVLLEFIKSSNTGINDKKLRYCAVKNFYEYYRADLPKPSKQDRLRAFRPSEMDKKRALLNKPVKVDEIKKIIIHAPQPYKAAFMVCFQGALGRSEYNQFNELVWKTIVDKLDEKGPIKINMIRQKTSKLDIKSYYTFLGGDAKILIKDWLNQRPETDSNALFVVYNRRKRKYVPLTGKRLADRLTEFGKKLGLIEDIGLNQYHLHLHEFRDLFKSLCTLSGVNPIASEFFLGHVIDKLGYDKSPEYDEEWFRNEYLKVEPKLNVLSGSGFDVEKAKEEVKKEVGDLIIELKKENNLLKRKNEELEKKIEDVNRLVKEMLFLMKENGLIKYPDLSLIHI